MTIEQQSLLAPIVFFDLFDYPLTSTEIWKYQWRGIGADSRTEGHGHGIELFDVRSRLDRLVESGVLKNDNGFYFLPGREMLIKTRNRRHVVAYRKWRRALRIIRLLRLFPYIRMIAVTNTLAYDNAADESDIDLFIVTKPGRIWTARFWVLTFLKLFHLRPRPGKERDKICCAFFVDDDHVNLQDVALPTVIASDPALAGERGDLEIASSRHATLAAKGAPRNDDRAVPDVYLYYWIATLWPVYNHKQTYENFFEQNKWVREQLPMIAPINPNDMRRVEPKRGVQRTIEMIVRFVPERAYHRFQEMTFPESIRELRGHDTRVVVSDTMLKFHTTDRREEYRKRFIETMNRMYTPGVYKG